MDNFIKNKNSPHLGEFFRMKNLSKIIKIVSQYNLTASFKIKWIEIKFRVFYRLKLNSN
jgi:hypothetical protein